jgi:hypothetical protein
MGRHTPAKVSLRGSHRIGRFQNIRTIYRLVTTPRHEAGYLIQLAIVQISIGTCFNSLGRSINTGTLQSQIPLTLPKRVIGVINAPTSSGRIQPTRSLNPRRIGRSERRDQTSGFTPISLRNLAHSIEVKETDHPSIISSERTSIVTRFSTPRTRVILEDRRPKVPTVFHPGRLYARASAMKDMKQICPKVMTPYFIQGKVSPVALPIGFTH